MVKIARKPLACSCLFLLAVLSLSGCGKDDYCAERAFWKLKRSGSLFSADVRSLPEDEFNRLRGGIEKVLAKYPRWSKSGELRLSIAEMCVLRNDLDAAEGLYRQVITDYPQSYESSAQAYFALGTIAERRGNWKAALENYDLIFEKYALSDLGLKIPLYIARYYKSKGMSADFREACEKAVRGYENLIAVNPYGKSVPVMHRNIVIACAGIKRPGVALSSLEKFAAKYPDSSAAPLALYMAAQIQRDVLGDNGKAIAIFEGIIRDYPDSKLESSFQFELGDLYAREGNLEKAQESFDEVVEQSRQDASMKVSARIAIAASYEQQKSWDKSLEIYDSLLKEYPADSQVLRIPLRIANHYFNTRNDAEAARALEKALRLYSETIALDKGKTASREARELSVTALILLKRYQDAAQALERLLRFYPEGDPSAPFALLKIASLYNNEIKDKVKARSLYEQFLKNYPAHRLEPFTRAQLDKLK